MSKKMEKVLIVDDEKVSREMIKLILNERVEVIEAKTAKEGYELAKSDEMDLIVMDVELPDGSGFEVTKKLKQGEKPVKAPVIFLTGYDDVYFEAQAFKAGAVDYITKPAGSYRIFMRLQAHLKTDIRGNVE